MFEEADGSELSLDLPAVGRGDRFTSWLVAPHNARPSTPLYRRNPDLYYWFDCLPDSRTLYIKYNVCQNDPTFPVIDFARELTAFVGSHVLDRIVIDVRNNGGGNSQVIDPILNALAASYLSGAINPSVQGYVIIGRETFSSGVLNAITMKSQGATLVGEPTGGKPTSYGDVLSLVLPNSNLAISYSTKLFQFPNLPGPSLAPDIAVETASADYFAERDPALETILAAPL